ncbi:hypothetical protein N7532_004546 [Penicillium argentinense]|uniref:Uncharacterized protein n=1 Tax=Penicillium argentinense TaxID=1131581 RepID=A0A9W9FQ26_9EURO|nr:uncharacterized protein N7532_004546 [Penicillium argentinense]KAJ5104017.1 hypothetical protein N7532_004546 [Penicillium argentinense]
MHPCPPSSLCRASPCIHNTLSNPGRSAYESASNPLHVKVASGLVPPRISASKRDDFLQFSSATTPCLSTSTWELPVSLCHSCENKPIQSSMCLSAPSSLASISLTNYLVNFNLVSPDLDFSDALPDVFDVTEYPFLCSFALDFDSAVGEVIWLGVPGPS